MPFGAVTEAVEELGFLKGTAFRPYIYTFKKNRL
jgi:hypothetical protein